MHYKNDLELVKDEKAMKLLLDVFDWARETDPSSVLATCQTMIDMCCKATGFPKKEMLRMMNAFPEIMTEEEMDKTWSPEVEAELKKYEGYKS